MLECSEDGVPIVVLDKGSVAASIGTFIIDKRTYFTLGFHEVSPGESGRELSKDEKQCKDNPFLYLAFNVDKKGLNVVRGWLDAVEQYIDRNI